MSGAIQIANTATPTATLAAGSVNRNRSSGRENAASAATTAASRNG